MGKVKRNPRVIVAFKQGQYDLIQRLAELQGVPMSKVIREFFEQVEPMLRDVATALEAAKAAQGRPAAELIAAMARMQATTQAMTEAAIKQGDMFAGQTARTIAKLKKQATRGTRKPVGKRKRARAT